MDFFKQASKLKLRFATKSGLLATEQLWDLKLTDLDALAVELTEEYEKSGKKSYLTVRSVKDKTTKLKLDIVLDIMATKQEEEEVAAQKLEDKKHNDKIFAALEKSEQNELAGKTPAQLKKMLR